jgi:serine protease Do
MKKFTLTGCVIAMATLAAYGASSALPGNQPASAAGVYGERPGSSYLGVDSRDITPQRAAELKLKQEVGVEVTMVDQDAPAGKAGVREGDVIVSLNGTPMQSVEQLRRMIREIPPGRTVTLGLLRNSTPITVKAQLANRQHMYAMTPALPEMPGDPVHVELPDVAIPAIPAMDIPSFDVIVHSASRGGMMVENLTPQLGDYFGVPNGHGVLIRSVEKNSPAERAGLRAGDVVVKVGEHSIADTSDWRNAMRAHHSGSVPLSIVRERKQQKITLNLPRQVGRATTASTGPTLSADVDMRALQAQLQRLQPQIERATAEAQLKLAQLRPEIERAQAAAWRHAQRDLERAQQQMHIDMEQAARRAQQELRLHRRELERFQQRMRAMDLHQDYI